MKLCVAFLGFLFLPGIYSQRPINDECLNATVIPSNRGITTNYTTAPIEIRTASANPLDPITNCSYFSYDDPRGTDGVTLWFSWRPQQTGEYEFFTDGSEYTDDAAGDDSFTQGITTIIGVFKGNACDSIEEIGCAYPFNKVRSVDLIGGEKYYIKVGMFEAFRGGKLVLTVKPAPPTPVNSQCINAITIDPSDPSLITGEISNALIDEASFPCADTFIGFNKGLWYKLTNTLSTQLSVLASTCDDGTEFDSIISVFEGSECGALSCVGNVDDVQTECGTKAVYGFLAAPQTTYYILIQGFENGEGFFKLGLEIVSDYFSLVDAESNRVIEPIADFVSYGRVNSRLNIQAVFANEAAIQSVQVTFDDPPRSYCEQESPYSVFWDTNGDFFDANPSIPIGSHTVTATAYAQNDCTGTAGISISKDFEVTGCDVQYAIYDTVILCPVYFLFGDEEFPDVVDRIPCDVNIQAYAYCGFVIDSVQIELRNTATDQVVATKTETTDPYFLFGNDGFSSLVAGSIDPGSYSISSTINGIKHGSNFFNVESACQQS